MRSYESDINHNWLAIFLLSLATNIITIREAAAAAVNVEDTGLGLKRPSQFRIQNARPSRADYCPP